VKDITVCIPIHDPQGVYYDYLSQACKSIATQTFLPKEVLIGGSLKPSYLDRIQDELKPFFPVRFLLNDSNSTSENLNGLIRDVSSEITKILFQDDFLISTTALHEISTSFESNLSNWLVAGSINYEDKDCLYVRQINPKFSGRIRVGKNTLGSPSSVSLITGSFLEFNEELSWMLDCEWYLRMYHSRGKPIILGEFHTANRIHDGQATHLAKSRHKLEVEMTKRMHVRKLTLKKYFHAQLKCSCTVRY